MVRNIPGAQGVTALNYIVQQTKPDGLTMIVGANIQLSPEDLASIEAAVPETAVEGARYDERGLSMVNL